MEVPRGLNTPGKRLKWWRENHTDYKTPTDAARVINRRYGIAVSTYLGHENETQNREIGRKSLATYAKFYKISLSWLAQNDGPPRIEHRFTDEFEDLTFEEEAEVRNYANRIRRSRA